MHEIEIELSTLEESTSESSSSSDSDSESDSSGDDPVVVLTKTPKRAVISKRTSDLEKIYFKTHTKQLTLNERRSLLPVERSAIQPKYSEFYPTEYAQAFSEQNREQAVKAVAERERRRLQVQVSIQPG